MAEERPHNRLEAWRQAVELVTMVYRTTGRFPTEERFALVDQMRRAAVSIPSNIAEGAARQSKKEFVQFLHVARGSLSELDTQAEIAARLGYMDAANREELDSAADAVSRLLSGLIRSLLR